MNQSDIYRYSERYEIDRQIEAMRSRIVEERRAEIGRLAAFREAIDATTGWYSAQYMRIENEVTARWGIDA